jgi:biopolymer transport protein ExbB
MLRVFSRKTVLFLLLLTVVLMLAGPAWAQGTAPAPKPKSQSLFERFFWSDDPTGRVVIWALVVTSVVGVSLIIMHSLRSRRSAMLPEDLALNVEQLLAERKYREAIELTANDPSMFARIIHDALSQASYGYAAMQQAIEDTGTLLTAERVRAIEPLNILGAVGPMAGLVGTVCGMIGAFGKMGGGQAKPEMLAGNISMALLCTLWGLIVAVPAIIAYGTLRARIEGLADAAMGRATKLVAPFRPAAVRRPAA